jgi:hypothetical protein
MNASHHTDKLNPYDSYRLEHSLHIPSPFAP